MKGGPYEHLAVTFAICGYRLCKRPASATSHRCDDVHLPDLNGKKAGRANELIHHEPGQSQRPTLRIGGGANDITR